MTPDDSAQLSVMVKVLTVLQTTFAVRSVGHKPTPGFNSVGGNGVLLALQNLNNLAISSNKQIITTGIGNRWRDVYTFVQPYNVSIVGERKPMVGAGGFTLGGMCWLVDILPSVNYHHQLTADLSRRRKLVPEYLGAFTRPSVTFPGCPHGTVPL